MRVTDLQRCDRLAHDSPPLHLVCWLASSRYNPERVMIGVTENISRSEVLIRWTAEANTAPLPNCGDHIAMMLKLPLGPRYLCCSGRVVRVSMSSIEALVAVEVCRMSFSGETEVLPAETMAKCAAN